MIGRFVADGKTVPRRIDLRSGESNAIGELGHEYLGLSTSRDGTLALIRYTDGDNYEIEVVDPTGALPSESLGVFPGGSATGARYGAVGARHVHYVFDSAQYTLIGRDDEGVLQSIALGEAGERADACDFRNELPPQDRLAFGINNGEGLLLVDLSEPLARSVLRLEPQHGGELRCPRWNRQGTALAYTETLEEGLDRHTWISLVRWPADGEPAPPEEVHDAALRLEMVLTRP